MTALPFVLAQGTVCSHPSERSPELGQARAATLWMQQQAAFWGLLWTVIVLLGKMKLTTCFACSELIWFRSTWAWGWLKMPQESRYPGRGSVPDGCGCFNHLVSDAPLAQDFYRKEPPCPNPAEMVFPALRCVSYFMSCRVILGFLRVSEISHLCFLFWGSLEGESSLFLALSVLVRLLRFPQILTP